MRRNFDLRSEVEKPPSNLFPPPPPPTVANHNTKTVFRYIDVLGDPQSHSEAVIREFKAL